MSKELKPCPFQKTNVRGHRICEISNGNPGCVDHCVILEEINNRDARIENLEKVLKEIANGEAGSSEPPSEMAGCMTSMSCYQCEEFQSIAIKALKGVKS